MCVLKPLPKEDVADFLTIAINAYPGMGIATVDDGQRRMDMLSKTYEESDRAIHGFYHDAKLLGGMILYDFTMKLRSVMVPAGVVGFVGVDLLYKKEHVAREMMSYFLRHNPEAARDAQKLTLERFGQRLAE